MKCCIQNCVNNGKVKKLCQSSTASSQKITFHLFPKDPKQRVSWLESLAIPNWMPTNRTVICSDHFKDDDFYFTKQGIRRIKHGVIPIIEDDCYGPAASRICKLCLALDAKMFRLDAYSLDKLYLDVMGFAPRIDEKNRLPMGICWECTARLQSAASFRSKALFSDALLLDHLKNNDDLKITDIQNLHRDHKNLKTTLAIQEVFKFNSHNAEEHAPNTLIKTEVIGIPHNEEIEVEVQNLVTEKITIKDERKNELLEELCPNDDVKTEIDLIPISAVEVASKESDFEDDLNFSDHFDVVTKEIDVNDLKMNFAETVLFDNKDKIEIDDSSNVSIDSDDDVNDEVQSTVINYTVDCPEEKPSELKKKKSGLKKVVKKKDESLIWMKGRPKKKPYVKPSIPIDENIFTVTMLNHEQLRQEIYARRDSEKYKQAPYKCDVCYRGFPTKDKQDRHVVKHSEQSGSIQCDICHVRLKKSRDLRAHMKRQHTSEFLCKLCPMVTRTKNVALGHMKYHAGSKYECPQCFIEFEKQTTLLNHLRLKHMSDCVCDLCGYTFVSKTGVVVHKRMKHKLFDKTTEFKGPFCEVCEVKFLTQKAYDRHLRLSSKHIKEDDPNRMSNDPSIKQRRLGSTWVNAVRRPVIFRRDVNRLPVNNRPVTCEQCGVELENLRVYASHFKYAHPGINRTQFTAVTTPYMCEHCGKFFLNSTTLAGHMWIHTGQKRFQCDHCNKTFSMKANLAGHMRQHEPVRRTYDCRVCGKHFTFSYNLTRHMFVHTGLRPYKCDACEKTFRTTGELRSHVDYVHLKKPRPKRVRRRVKKCDSPSLEY